MTWTIPNILTVARLVAAPLLPVMFLWFDRGWADWYALILFIVASVTDWFDGYLARAMKQESLFGAAMDPIADKAMVLIALLVINGYSGMTPWILLPSALIIYREVFVSGLRETLGDKSRLLKVTKLAKWKTTAQMVALSLLFLAGVFEHYVQTLTEPLDADYVAAILARQAEDTLGLLWRENAAMWSNWAGTVFLWVAGLLTVVTGFDYFAKALPFLREKPND